MRIIYLLLRWFFGVLFIFSGLVKANDPLGLSYKMQEFFEVWGMGFLDSWSLTLAYAMNVLEIVLGVSVLTGRNASFFLKIALALLVFFSFLTGYAEFSGKIKTCGCFGDCLPLTSFQSFLKDILLLIINIILLLGAKRKQQQFSKLSANIFIGTSFIATILLQNYVLKHLPLVDCLPYKEGNNIWEMMQNKPKQPNEIVEVWYTYEKNGKQLSFNSDAFPDDFDSTYQFVAREDKVIAKSAKVLSSPVEFYLQTLSGNDTTAELLTGNHNYLLIKNFKPNLIDEQKAAIFNWVNSLKAQKQTPIIVTSDPDNAKAFFKGQPVTIVTCDATVIKTAARVRTTVMKIDKGTIVQKKALADVNEPEK
ncbi:MAG: BT_3928 family protein [Chitinophagaceae bacterium]